MAGVKGRSGGVRKPTELHVLHGTDRPDRQNPDEPKPELLDFTPEPPAVLDAGARREWNRIAPELVKLHLLSKLDLAALVGYCQAFSDQAAARKELKRRGRYVKSREGVRTLNPAVRDSYRSAELMRTYLIEFGMSPSSRARVVTGGGGAVERPNGQAQASRPRPINRLGEAV